VKGYAFGLLFLCWACGERPVPDSAAADQDAFLEEEPAAQAAPAEESASDMAELPVTVYYRHPFIMAMIPHRRHILNHPKPAERIKQVIDMLTIAPPGSEDQPIWPQGSYIRELYVLPEGTLVIDFKQRALDRLSVGAAGEELMIVSLVNSILESFPELKVIRLLLDGEVRESLLGHVDIEYPLGPGHNPYSLVPGTDPGQEIIEEDFSREDPPPVEDKRGPPLDKSI